MEGIWTQLNSFLTLALAGDDLLHAPTGWTRGQIPSIYWIPKAGGQVLTWRSTPEPNPGRQSRSKSVYSWAARKITKFGGLNEKLVVIPIPWHWLLWSILPPGNWPEVFRFISHSQAWLVRKQLLLRGLPLFAYMTTNFRIRWRTLQFWIQYSNSDG
jgi:hypothetical protein